MTTLNRREEHSDGAAKRAGSEPRLLRRSVYANCAFSLIAFGLLLIGDETEQYTLALVGLVFVMVGTLGWIAVFAWLVILFVRDVRAITAKHGSLLRWLFQSSRNRNINSNPD